MEFIDGQPLDSLWFSLTEPEKASVVDEVAQIIATLSQIDLGGIGGLTLDHKLGPTVEGMKLFKGRVSQCRSRGLFHDTAKGYFIC